MSHKSVSGTDINSNNHTCGFCDNVLNEDIGSECDFCDADLCDSCMETCLSCNIAQYCKDCSRTCEVEVFQHTACKDCFHEPDPPPLDDYANRCPNCQKIFCLLHRNGVCSDCDSFTCMNCQVQYCKICSETTCAGPECGGLAVSAMKSFVMNASIGAKPVRCKHAPIVQNGVPVATITNVRHMCNINAPSDTVNRWVTLIRKITHRFHP